MPLSLLRADFSLRGGVLGFDEGPPFFDFGRLKGGKRLRSQLLAREDFLRQIDELCADDGVSQGPNDGAIELIDDFFGRALGGPKRVPEREIKSRQSCLVG